MEEEEIGLSDTNHVLIGDKPFMNYVTGVIVQFTRKNADEVIVKARGKHIARAVDVAEVARTRFLTDQVDMHDVQINSEQFVNREGNNVRVSTIEITLKKRPE